MSTLQIIWFALIGLFVVVYTLLDGFDLGVGICYAFARREDDRRVMLNAIGPYWDGNEVWLLLIGGMLFAAFPPVYATVFSAFYLPLMLLLLALILRGVALAFRGQTDSPRARRWWDVAFAGGSLLATLLLGVAFGNILLGFPFAHGEVTAPGLADLLNPFALLVGLLNVAMLATHGALYLAMRTEATLAKRARYWAHLASWAYLALAVTTVLTACGLAHLRANYQALPVAFALPILSLWIIARLRLLNTRTQSRRAFAASCLGISGLLAAAAVGLFPALVPVTGWPGQGLTVANSASSPLTLATMLVVALVGLVLVGGYTTWLYRTFAGKVRAGEGHY